MLLFIVLVDLFKHPGIFSTLFTTDIQQVTEGGDQKVTSDFFRCGKVLFYSDLEVVRLLIDHLHKIKNNIQNPD
jgi:hypothetical protein